MPLGSWEVPLPILFMLGLTVLVGGILSAVLANDVVVFALTPLVCRSLLSRKLDPRPFLIALAGAEGERHETVAVAAQRLDIARDAEAGMLACLHCVTHTIRLCARAPARTEYPARHAW